MRAEENVVVTVKEDSSTNTYHVEGVFDVTASKKQAWKVLTDYNHLASFVSTIQASQVLYREKDYLLLKQEMSGRYFIFSKKIHLVLRVFERPMKQITFEDTLLKDFEFYVGQWEIQQKKKGCRVEYQLKAKTHFGTPHSIQKSIFQRDIKKMMEQVAARILSP